MSPKVADNGSLENRIFMPIAKFGFPIVLAVFFMWFFFISYLPKTEERSQNMINMCFVTMKDLTHSIQGLEGVMGKMSERIEQNNLCSSPKK